MSSDSIPVWAQAAPQGQPASDLPTGNRSPPPPPPPPVSYPQRTFAASQQQIAPPIGTYPARIDSESNRVKMGQGSEKPLFFPPPAATSQQGNSGKLTLKSLAEVEMRSIEWLWNGYLPSGKLSLLAGASGAGKSTIAYSFAAIITAGTAWPDGKICSSPGNVLIWSSEDGMADTIKPRLVAMGADLAKCYNIPPDMDAHGTMLPFDPSRDIDRLHKAVDDIGGVSLFIIDPIVSAITGDMNKANEVRRGLQTIVDFAARFNCAVLGITHFAKGTAGRKSDERVIGSQAFAAFARVVLVAAKEEESERRVFTRAKSNISLDSGGFSYLIEEIALHHGILATRIVWGEELQGSARSILAEVEHTEQSDDSAIGRAKQFLLKRLKDGSVPSKELLEHAREELNISEKTLKRAKEQLGIIAKKSGFGGGWTWEMPFDQAALDAITSNKKSDSLPWPQ